MRIVLLFPPWSDSYGIFSYFARRSSAFPPMGLAYLAAIAEAKGHTVKIIDGEVERLSIDRLIDETLSFKPDLIGITAASPFWHRAVKVAKGFKSRDKKIPIAVGGPHITVIKEAAFDENFDFGFIGQAEKSWGSFLDNFGNGNLSQVKGILFRENNRIVNTGDPDIIMNIDLIPFPARHLLNAKKYRMGTKKGRKVFSPIMTTRGCPYKCVFCTTAVSGSTVRRRSPRAVVDEMKIVVTEQGINHFYIVDDTLTLSRKHILEICRLINKEGLNITFEGQTRADLLDEELIENLVRSGLIRLGFGFETADANIRKIIKKELSLENYVKSNRLANKYGVEVLNSAILGLPGETRETAKKTIDFLRKARDIHHVNFCIATPYPGTELLRMAKNGEHGLKLLTENFAEYRRYGHSVLSVNDLSPEDLIELQNEAYYKTYIMPWRIIPMLKKQGIVGVFLTYSRFFITMFHKIVK
jgi:anaerobic magnesium-protoporphyrin IX monomethyl ester cyclase